MLDCWLWTLALAFLAGVLFPSWTTGTNETVVGLVLFALTVPVQALLLSMCGTTIGKALLGIQVIRNGRKLGFGEALKRESQVYFAGMGLGLPLISLFTQIAGYTHLRDHRASTWDQGNGNAVIHKDPKALGVIGAVILTFGCLVVIGYGYSAGQGY